MTDVIVIGGGISGLVAAWKLKGQGYSVKLLEAGKRLGGNIGTVEEEGFRLELGPYSYTSAADQVWNLINELKLDDYVVKALPSADNRYIFRDDRLHEMPMGFKAFLFTRLLSWRSKLRLMLEPLIPNGAKLDDTAWEFFCRRFGKEATTYLMGPFVSGIYAGDVKQLGARAAFPKFWNFENERGSMILGAMSYMKEKKRRLEAEGKPMRKGMFSFNDGLGFLIEQLGELIWDIVELESPVSSIEKQGNGFVVSVGEKRHVAQTLVLAVQPQDAAEILKNILPQVSDELLKIPMAAVSLVHWSPNPDDGEVLPPGFGFLVPRLYDIRLLGTVMASSIFPNRVVDGRELFSSYYGGVTDPDFLKLSDDDVVERLREDHSRITGKAVSKPSFVRVLRYQNAIPQLLPVHPELRRSLEQSVSEAAPGLILAGNYLSGVAMSAAVESGYEAAQKVAGYMSENVIESVG